MIGGWVLRPAGLIWEEGGDEWRDRLPAISDRDGDVHAVGSGGRQWINAHVLGADLRQTGRVADRDSRIAVGGETGSTGRDLGLEPDVGSRIARYRLHDEIVANRGIDHAAGGVKGAVVDRRVTAGSGRVDYGLVEVQEAAEIHNSQEDQNQAGRDKSEFDQSLRLLA